MLGACSIVEADYFVLVSAVGCTHFTDGLNMKFKSTAYKEHTESAYAFRIFVDSAELGLLAKGRTSVQL